MLLGADGRPYLSVMKGQWGDRRRLPALRHLLPGPGGLLSWPQPGMGSHGPGDYRARSVMIGVRPWRSGPLWGTHYADGRECRLVRRRREISVAPVRRGYHRRASLARPALSAPACSISSRARLRSRPPA